MELQILNRNSYGGEIISIKTPNEDLIKELQGDGIRVKFWEDSFSFMLTDLSKVSSRRTKQELIDLIEEEGGYDIHKNLIK